MNKEELQQHEQSLRELGIFEQINELIDIADNKKLMAIKVSEGENFNLAMLNDKLRTGYEKAIERARKEGATFVDDQVSDSKEEAYRMGANDMLDDLMQYYYEEIRI